MELISSVPRVCIGLSNPLLSANWKWKNPNYIVEKPVRYHLNQVIKVSMIVDIMCHLIYR